MTGRKILIVSHIDLFPTNAGNRKRIVDTITLLKRNGNDVYFMNFGVVTNYYQKLRYARFLGEGKYFCYEKYDYKFKERAEKRRVSNDSVYYDVDELIPSGFGKYARKIIKENKFDVVIAEYVMASYVLTLVGKRILKIIDTHDIMTDRDKLFTQAGEKPQGIYFKKEEEVRGLKRADIVWAIQSEEERVLKNWLSPHTKVVMVGNPMKIVDLPLSDNKKILFIGSGNTLNTNAARWLVDEVIPLVKKKVPDADFLLGGTVCNKVDDSNQYTKLGFVEDATKLYEQVRIVVNPIKGGTGLNIKTMEALSYGKPLVSTSVGVKGLKKIDSFIMVRDDPEGFADSIVKLLQSLELCRNIQKKTYKYMEFYNSLCEKRIKAAVEGRKKATDRQEKCCISVVTVCRNAEESIEKTIQSVVRQDYRDIDYVIKDGNSEDGTLDIIKRYAKDYPFIKYVSDRDGGIYDAMNTAAKMTKGKYVIFINAGDVFCSRKILSKEVELLEKEKADIAVGNWKKHYKEKVQYVNYCKNSLFDMLRLAFKYYHMANHQSIVARKELVLTVPFNQTLKISADFDWYLKMLKKALLRRIKIVKLDEFVVEYSMDGVSAQKDNYRQMIDNCRKSVREQFPFAEKLHCDDWKIQEVLDDMHITEEKLR